MSIPYDFPNPEEEPEIYIDPSPEPVVDGNPDDYYIGNPTDEDDGGYY